MIPISVGFRDVARSPAEISDPGATLMSRTLRVFLGAAGFVMQVVSVCLGSMAASAFVSHIIGTSESHELAAVQYATVAVFGLALAVATSSVVPAAVGGGRWVWLLPVILLFAGICWEMSLGRPRMALYNSFLGSGEAGLSVIFVTQPALGCCCYSAVMAWQRRQWERRALL